MIETFLQSLESAWRFLLLISNGPLGAYAVLAALVGSGAAMPFLRKAFAFMPCDTQHCRDARDFCVETCALAVGVLCAWVPLPNMNGLLVGVLAGLASPYVWKGLAALAGIALAWLRKRAE